MRDSEPTASEHRGPAQWANERSERSGEQMTAGIVLAATPEGGQLAWTGVEVVAATDLTRLSGYAALGREQRLAQAHREDVAYLRRLAGLPRGTALDYRWLAGPDGLRLAVLARCAGESARHAVAAGQAVRDQLGRLPEHVRGVPVSDPEALHHLLYPFQPAAAAQLRRLAITGQPCRPDAHATRYVLVEQCGWHPERWQRLLDALAAHPGRAMLSVGLQPWTPPRQLVEVLAHEAAQYARLAREVRVPGAGLVGRTTLAAEPFAVRAAPLYAQAARRYAGPAFRARVTLAGSGPLERELVEAALAAFGTDDPAGLGATVPAGRELAGVGRLLHGLGVPAACADPALLLASLADPEEAAGYCPLPAADGWSALPVEDPEPHRLAGGLSVAGDYVRGAKLGGDTIVAGGKQVYQRPR